MKGGRRELSGSRVLRCVARSALVPPTEIIDIALPRPQLPLMTWAPSEVAQYNWHLLHFTLYQTSYLVRDALASALDRYIKRCLLVPFFQLGAGRALWDIEVRKAAGDWLNPWAISAREIALGTASEMPVLIARDTRQKRYVATPMPDVKLQMNWQGFDYIDAVDRIFGDRVIDSQEHPVFRYLTGRGGL